MLDPDGGVFSILPDGDYECRQSYLNHSNILVTHFKASDDSEFRVIDFCPRFNQHDRVFRPLTVIRIVEPVKGNCRIRVRCEPVSGWDKKIPQPIEHESGLSWDIRDGHLHLVSSMSKTHLKDSAPFLLEGKAYFALSWGEKAAGNLGRVCDDSLNETRKYWNLWVKHCNIPSLYQKETIRSALALKLCCYEDTGAILAALTTSLPEEIGNVRNWDYRFCWLRDAYFVLNAFQRIGHFEEMEQFLKFLLNLVGSEDYASHGLAPVYALDHQRPIPEIIQEEWGGYKGSRPVRTNNQAAEHVQNDVYGEMVLTFSPIFFDQRFEQLVNANHEMLLKNLILMCSKNLCKADAGLWEIRNGWQEHTFSNLMCWAGLRRGLTLQQLGFLKDMEIDLNAEKTRAEKAIEKAVSGGSLRNGPTDPTFDASMLLLPILRYPDRKLCEKTVDDILKALTVPGDSKGFLYRYSRPDDFGKPHSAFLLCSFWLAQALAVLGRKQEGIAVLDSALKAANPLGIFAEHFDPRTGLQSGNFPQAYSHVGLINAAFALSPPWEEAF